MTPPASSLVTTNVQVAYFTGNSMRFKGLIFNISGYSCKMTLHVIYFFVISLMELTDYILFNHSK